MQRQARDWAKEKKGSENEAFYKIPGFSPAFTFLVDPIEELMLLAKTVSRYLW